MNFTDKELLRSSQIAYYDISSNAISEIPEEYRSLCTLKTLFCHSVTFRDSIYKSLSATCGFTVTENDKEENVLDNKALEGNEAKKVAVSAVYDIIEELQDDKVGSIGSWKLVSFVFNDDIGVKGVAGKLVDGQWVTDNEFSPSGDGLCAYVFETADDSAIVAFRGSQPLDNVDIMDFVSDWLAADIGLALENDETVQQKSTEQYIKDYVNVLGYDHYAFAGHSLGGNLYPRLNNRIIQSAA